MRRPVMQWPGVARPIGCTYTLGHGVSPGVAALTIAPQDVRKVRPIGNLSIGDGVNKPLILKNARVVDVQYSSSASGPRTVTLHIADRRWQWAFGHVTGQFNVVDRNTDLSTVAPGEYSVAGGPFAPGTYRPLASLMADCLAAMNERAGTVAGAPLAAPPVNWEFSNPATELEALCTQFGLRVCYSPPTDTVAVLPLGTGGKLPDLPGPASSAAFDVPGRPSGIVVFCGPTLYNDVLMLEPVGLEPDGEIRPIDKLSYKPANGWESDNPHFFAQARATAKLTKAEATALALRHVWRTFRVKMVDAETGKAPGPNVPGFGLVKQREQIVLMPVQYQDVALRGDRYTLPPDVYGSINVSGSPELLDRNVELTNGNTGPEQKLPAVPSIDGERGLVTFDRIMAQVVAGRTAAPVLRLRTSFSLRSVVGRRYERLSLSDTLSGIGLVSGCPPEAVYRPELVYMIETGRRPSNWSIRQVTNNRADVVPALRYYLAAAAAKYVPKGRADRVYAGIVPFGVDGLVHQVTWSVGNGAPATTQVSVNGEHSAWVPSYPEKRRLRSMEKAAALLDVKKAEDNNKQARPGHQGPLPTFEYN